MFVTDCESVMVDLERVMWKEIDLFRGHGNDLTSPLVKLLFVNIPC